MAIDQLDEYEQGEKVRSWLRTNGSSLIIGIALGLGLIYGWKLWQGKDAQKREEAATQYTAMTDAITAKDEAKVKTFAAVIDAQYADSPFAPLARMRHAQFLQASGKTDEAIKLLAAAPTPEDPALAELQRLRLGRLQLIAGKADDALKTIDAIATPSLFPGVLGELRGDIQAARGKRDEARKAYEAALTALDEAAPMRRLVELKLIDAGGKPPAAPEA
jgi:predicted negative regulator of RcsB-dependent stress response